MELRKVNTRTNKIVVAPIGDIQWDGETTAVDIIRAHVKEALELDAWFIGMGDYIDFLSPSNRQRLTAAALYDTAKKAINKAAHGLVEEVYETVLKPTKGRWLGMLEGHHFFEAHGETSDQWLATMLDAEFLGTSAFVKLEPSGIVLYAHHGRGNSVLPTGPLNKLYHTSHGWVGADVYLMGHTTKENAARISRPMPEWDTQDLTHRDILLVNTGGFSKSSVVGSRDGSIPRGDYAEQGMMTPSPLSAPFIYIDGKAKGTRRARVLI